MHWVCGSINTSDGPRIPRHPHLGRIPDFPGTIPWTSLGSLGTNPTFTSEDCHLFSLFQRSLLSFQPFSALQPCLGPRFSVASSFLPTLDRRFSLPPRRFGHSSCGCLGTTQLTTLGCHETSIATSLGLESTAGISGRSASVPRGWTGAHAFGAWLKATCNWRGCIMCTGCEFALTRQYRACCLRACLLQKTASSALPELHIPKAGSACFQPTDPP